MKLEVSDLTQVVVDSPSTRQSRTLFHALSFRMTPGQRLGICGASGSGKSTLLRIVSGILKPTYGEVRWDDLPIHRYTRRQIRNKRKHMGIVMQNAGNAFHPQWMMFRSLTEPTGTYNAAEVKSWVEQLRLLPVVLQARPHELSGGQLQRLQLLRALIHKPTVLLLDEPMSQLDPDTKSVVSHFLDHWLQTHQSSAFIISHDERWLHRFTDSVITIVSQ
jgi:ABC-type dipeptide/oligopeptide/nickel transport system ATPase subunit